MRARHRPLAKVGVFIAKRGANCATFDRANFKSRFTSRPGRRAKARGDHTIQYRLRFHKGDVYLEWREGEPQMAR
jgi:hypothetical protein